MIGITSRVSLVIVLGLMSLAPPVWSQEEKDKKKTDEIKFLIEGLWKSESRIRQKAAERLTELDEKPFDELISVLAHGTQFQSASAAIVLTNLKEEDKPIPAKARKQIYDILHQPGTEIWRWNITASLVMRIAEDSLKNHVPLWTWGVNHPSAFVQLPSLRALQKTKEAGFPAQSAVAGMLNRHHRPFTSIVLKPQIITDGLMGIEQPIPPYDVLTILETLAAIKADPNLMVGPLTKLTHNGNEYVQLASAAMLGKVEAARLSSDPRPHAVRVLADLAVRPWGKVRLAAVRELGKIGEPSAFVLPTLEKLLDDSNDDVRMEAAITLGKIGLPARSSLPALKEALRFAKLDTQDAVDAITEAIKKIEDAIEKTEKKKDDQKDPEMT